MGDARRARKTAAPAAPPYLSLAANPPRAVPAAAQTERENIYLGIVRSRASTAAAREL